MCLPPRQSWLSCYSLLRFVPCSLPLSFCPFPSCDGALFYCNNPLHVRARGVGVSSRIRMLFQQIDRARKEGQDNTED